MKTITLTFLLPMVIKLEEKHHSANDWAHKRKSLKENASDQKYLKTLIKEKLLDNPGYEVILINHIQEFISPNNNTDIKWEISDDDVYQLQARKQLLIQYQKDGFIDTDKSFEKVFQEIQSDGIRSVLQRVHNHLIEHNLYWEYEQGFDDYFRAFTDYSKKFDGNS